MEINKLTQYAVIVPTFVEKSSYVEEITDKFLDSTLNDSGMTQIEALKKLASRQSNDIETVEQNLIDQFDRVVNNDTPIVF